MTYEIRAGVLHASGNAGVEDAEALHQLLCAQPVDAADLTGVTYLHCANLQVLMAAGVPVLRWPQDAALAAWLSATLPATNSNKEAS